MIFFRRLRERRAHSHSTIAYFIFLRVDNGLVQKLTLYVDQNKHLATSAQASKEEHDKMARQYTVMKEQG